MRNIFAQSKQSTVTITPTEARRRLFELMQKLADGEIPRVLIRLRNGRLLQLTYEGKVKP